jgi:hypothetical protein
MASMVSPGGIPYLEVDLAAVTAAAGQLREVGAGIRDGGADVVDAWRPISGVYAGPADETLFAAMDPVGPTSTSFGDSLDSIAGALDVFVEEVRPVVAELARLKTAADDFVARAGSYEGQTIQTMDGPVQWKDNWYEDGDLNDENSSLVNGISAQVVAYQDAERTCANTVRALSCLPPLHAASGEDDPLAYGYRAIPAGTATDWGTAGEREESCSEKTLLFLPDLVWNGIVVDGLGASVAGLGELVGIRDWHFSIENFTSTWKSMGSLIGYDQTTNEWWQGDAAGESWLGAAKDMIAFDVWADDPGRALGTSIFNIGTFILPPVGIAAKLGKLGGTAGKIAAKGARVAEALDPLTWGAPLAKLGLPKLGELAKVVELRMAEVSLGTHLNLDGIEVPGYSGGRFDLDSSAHGDPPVPPARSEGGAGASQPVPERVSVGAGGGGHQAGGGQGGGGNGGGSSSGGAHGWGGGGTPQGPGGADPLDPAPSPDPSDPAPAPGGADGPRVEVDWRPEMGAPHASGATRGDGWTLSDPSDIRGTAVRADYGTAPIIGHGHLAEPYMHPLDPDYVAGAGKAAAIPPEVHSLIRDPGNLYGNDPVTGQRLTRAEFEELYIGPDDRPEYPGNAGSAGAFVDFTDPAAFVSHYGSTLDRLGGDTGEFLSFPGTSFEQRALPPSNLADPYSTYTVDPSKLPSGATIEVSVVEKAFGRPGGGLQVRVLNASGKSLSTRDLVSSGFLS